MEHLADVMQSKMVHETSNRFILRAYTSREHSLPPAMHILDGLPGLVTLMMNILYTEEASTLPFQSENKSRLR